ncbi:Uncharacterised protein [Vibrio cholerae]|nr:hypothetical protein VCEC0051_001757 [Vibrio cholerae O1 str. EC-0051]CSC48691.1 Uncharacterised protein [Vibrio cholerae]CSI67668.1 Uncharacterised protein [Vibrio cholerae]CSI93366.1 Uncharacterised protein [Vibrio cholerae]
MNQCVNSTRAIDFSPNISESESGISYRSIITRAYLFTTICNWRW